MQTLFPFTEYQTPMPICNKTFLPNEDVYRYHDCIIHETAVPCQRCFKNNNHKAHRYERIGSGEGNCDCGNTEVFEETGFCVHHPGKADPLDIESK